MVAPYTDKPLPDGVIQFLCFPKLTLCLSYLRDMYSSTKGIAIC